MLPIQSLPLGHDISNEESVMPKRTSPGTKRKKHSRILEQINHSAAGIDAGAEWHFVAVPEERATPSVRKFATTTGGLYALADWLAAAGIDTVAVEATGVYCMPLLDVLDGRGLAVVLAKPASLKSVNDRRKTDMLDCQWIQMRHGFGLLRRSLRPTQMVAAFRTHSRQLRMLIEQASTAIEHMKKALTSMNIRVELAVSDITGRTGMHIIRAIVAGERDPMVLAGMRDERCAKSEQAIAEALLGKYSDEQLFALDQGLRTWDHYQLLIAECSQRLAEQSNAFEKKADRKNLPKARQPERERKNGLPLDSRAIYYEILGQDLTQIDSIGTSTTCAFIAEVGTNVDAFPSVKHFTSFLRLSPGSNISGGKNKSGKNRRTTNRLATALRLAAQTLTRSQSALGAFYRRKRAQLGAEKAITAAAHKLARMIYFTLKEQRPYLDPGPDHYLQRHRERIIRSMEKRAQQLGYQLVRAA